MPKTTIQCNFRDSIGNALSGYVLVGVDSWLLKDDLDQSISTLTTRVELTAGQCTLLLEPSEVDYVTYWFEVWHYKEVTTSDPETGEPVVSTTEVTLLPRFYARVPSSVTPIHFNQLVKQTGINRDNIDTALSAITRRLYNEDTFWARLQENLFVARGSYSPTAWYSRGDVVTWDGGSYLYYNTDRTQGTLPSTTTYWQLLSERGETGAGTTGNNSPLDAGWLGALDAPSRNAVYLALQGYALTSTVSGLAPISSPVFTGDPRVSTAPALNDDSTKIPNTAWVRDILTDVVKAMTPVGMVTQFAGGSTPLGWVPCDGSTLSQATYSALYAIIGTTYNTGGEAPTDFRVPSLPMPYPPLFYMIYTGV